MQKITVKMIREMDKEGIYTVFDNYKGSIITEKDFEQLIKSKKYYPLDVDDDNNLVIMTMAGALLFKALKKICTPAAYKTCIDRIKEELHQE